MEEAKEDEEEERNEDEDDGDDGKGDKRRRGMCKCARVSSRTINKYVVATLAT